MSRELLEAQIAYYLWQRVHGADQSLCTTWASGIIDLIEREHVIVNHGPLPQPSGGCTAEPF